MKWAANVRERAENLSKFSSIGPLFTPLSGIKQHSASELRGQLPRGTDANAQQRELQRQPAKSFELFETASERKESAEKEQTKQCKEFAAAGLTSGETSEAASDRKENTEKRRKKQSEEFAAAAGLTPTDELDITASTSTPSFLRNLSFVYRMPKLFRTNTYSFKK
ncbi:hypothetical protein niasHS_010411 [Heterodera schachtii]|uniref:Uncharacterized protein n=1 Tax=Heterodera schachtii TaxID=97005 RepID=A0ABD2IZN5_HETSC